jgi:DNA-binding NarL/FixJ family response regulator
LRSRYPSMPRAGKKIRLLIADDHQLVREGIRSLLKASRDFAVVGEAVDGNDAVEKAKALSPDVAILDITMPVVDGLEATQQIRKVSPSTKVLVLTMHDSTQMVRRVIEAGAIGYVLKSDLASQLVRAVKSVVHGEVFLTPKVSEIVMGGFLHSEDEAARNSSESEPGRPSDREKDVIRLLTQGKSNKETASILGITTRTVETHRARIMMKLRVHSLVELVQYANRHGIK